MSKQTGDNKPLAPLFQDLAMVKRTFSIGQRVTCLNYGFALEAEVDQVLPNGLLKLHTIGGRIRTFYHETWAVQ